MKIKSIIFASIFIIMFTFNVFAAENIVQNSGFENDMSKWDKQSWGDKPETANFIIDSNEKRTGAKSSLVKNNIETDSRVKQELSVKPNTYYRFTAYVKTSGIGANSKGANLSVDGITDTSRDIKGDNDWQQLELYGKTDKKQKNLTITLGVGGYGSLNVGKAWFDDVSFEEVSSVPASSSSVNFFKPPTQATKTNTKPKAVTSSIYYLFALVFLGLIGGYLFKYNKNKRSANKELTYNYSKIDRFDLLIMSLMTIIYLGVALFNLGSTNVPQSSWKSAKQNESFIVDFNKNVDLSRIYYYGGLGDGKYVVEYADSSGKFLPLITIDKKEIFNWKYHTVSGNTNKLKITSQDIGSTINELAFVAKDSIKPIEGFVISNSTTVNDTSTLFDEQSTFAYKASYLTGMYFDEIYHARTAYEHLNAILPYEWTHPPLGKIIISLGIYLFGMNPFGWRIMGMLFGVGMIPLMYLFGKKLFKGRFYAFCSAFLMMFDFMHFSQTRIATIDSYVTFFIILMYYYMFDFYMNKSYEIGLKRSLKPLFLSGLFFGIGAASKWIGIYAGAGLALLYFVALYEEYKDYLKLMVNKKLKKPEWTENFMKINVLGSMLWNIVFFVAIPGIIYYLSYVPTMRVPNLEKGFKLVKGYQTQMFNYHSKLEATHAFSSPWYEWPVIYKPTWFYSGGDLAAGKASTIVTMGNPAIWWIGVIAIFMALVISVRKKERAMSVIFIAMTFQYIPWVLVSRITWIYHFFSTVPFMILCIVYIIKNLIEEYKNIKYAVYAYLLVVALLFVWFYPALSGYEVNKGYIDSLKWFKSWIF